MQLGWDLQQCQQKRGGDSAEYRYGVTYFENFQILLCKTRLYFVQTRGDYDETNQGGNLVMSLFERGLFHGGIKWHLNLF